MNEHLTQEQIEHYGKKHLAPGEWAGISTHLQECEACAQDIQASFPMTLGGPLNFGNAVPVEEAGPEHLTYEEMSAYLDEQADEFEREIVETHIDSCQMCRNDLAELREIRLELTAAERSIPIPSEALITEPDDELKSESLWSRLRASWTGERQSAPLFGGMGVLAGAAATLLFVLAWRSSHNVVPTISPKPTDPQEIARLQTERDQAVTAKREAETLITQRDAQLNQSAQRTLAQQKEIERLRAMKPQNPHSSGDSGESSLAQLYVPGRDGQVAALNPVPTNLMGGDTGSKSAESFYLLRPYGTFVSSRQPIFSWTPVPGARKYKVRILRSGSLYAAAFLVEKSNRWYVQILNPETVDEENPQTISESLNPLATGTDWQLPQQLSLQYGQKYSWNVMAYRKEIAPNSETTDNKEQEIPSQVLERDQALFAVLNKEQTTKLQELRERLAKQPLELCQVYLRLGLLSEAEETLKGYLQNQPTSKTGRQLLLELTKKRALRTKS